MYEIDGSYGEGGGQILRSALALSLVTQEPFSMHSIRNGRSKPGLMRQHLACVLAAAEISQSRVRGASIGSTEIEFIPSPVKPGAYDFNLDGAGSTSLVLQCLLPALVKTSSSSTLKIRGGTHNPWAPSFDYLQRVFFPLLERIGISVCGTLVRPGFYPAGAGEVLFSVTPGIPKPLKLASPEVLQHLQLVSTIAGLPSSIAQRQLRSLGAELGVPENARETVRLRGSLSPGNLLAIEYQYNTLSDRLSLAGRRGLSSQKMVRDLSKMHRNYLESAAPVGPYLADQLPIWMALAGSGSFCSGPATPHLESQFWLLTHFLGNHFSRKQVGKSTWRYSLNP